MSNKEKVFIVTTHYRKTSKHQPGVWESHERVEFLNRVKNNQLTTATVVIDYLDERVIIGSVKGIKFDEYIQYLTKTYPKQMEELRKAYKPETDIVVPVTDNTPAIEVVDGEIQVAEQATETV